ncbi:WD repeat-containing protein 25 [Pelodytes ibericus]
MNSLVDYEDSDSETESTQDCKFSKMDQDAENSNTGAENSTRVFMPPILPRDVNIPPSWKTKEFDSIGASGHEVGSKVYISIHTAQSECKGNIHAVNAVRTCGNHFSISDSYAKKRPCSVATHDTVVKPYIPKRIKQEHSSYIENKGRETPTDTPISTANVLWNVFQVSEYLAPYLHVKYRATEIPQKVVFLMNEHTAPVNRVQWNPVWQYSHLLLSAAMDTTVKIWDAVDSGKCLSTFSYHSKAARDAQWSVCGHKILSGGFDSMLYLTDVETGKQLYKARNEFKISASRFQPTDPNIFLCAGFSSALKAWDTRVDKPIHTYKAAVQQHFEILFLPGGKEFLSTTDSVSRDSADRTIIAWDFAMAAKISNQIFHERYTCPSLALHPKEGLFIAQTNGNYIALFSTQRPYKMNKKKRFEGHKVEGFAVGCEFSPDGSLIVTGSSEGKVFFYNYHTSRMVRSIPGDGNACVSATFHPVLPSLLATAYWDGNIRIWQ